jgi:putative DNA primase/helicase
MSAEPEDHKGKTKREIERSPHKPPVLPLPLAQDVPAEMRDRAQWVAWQWRWRADRGTWTKEPVNARTGRNGKSNSPETWTDLETALAYCRNHPDRADGVGFVLTEGDPLAVADLDDGIDVGTGRPKPWAERVVRLLDSYTEISPTETGVKVFLLGRKPGTRCEQPVGDGKVELFDRVRFVCVTGRHHAGTPHATEHRQAELSQLYTELFGEEGPDPAGAKTNGRATGGGPGMTESEVLDLVNSGRDPKLTALFNGDVSGHGGDDSRADSALVWKLVYYCHDGVTVDRVFRLSALMRGKWDAKHCADGRTYGQLTIDKAMEGVKDRWERSAFGGAKGVRLVRNGGWRHGGGTEGSQAGGGENDGQPREGGDGPDEEQRHLTDRGNAMRLVRTYGRELHHCLPWKKWQAWDGGRWRTDDTAEVTLLAKWVIVGLCAWAVKKLEGVNKILGDGADEQAA